MSTSLRIIFSGTPDFAAQHLRALLATPHEIVAVFTQPDRPAGRGNKLTHSPVKQLAQQNGIPIYQPDSLKETDNQQCIQALNADLMIVVAYGLILPQAVLAMPRYGCINVHGSLLPRWRGAAPIQRACWAGDSKTGITIMQMDEGLDTGDILHSCACDILPSDTSASLYEKLAKLGSIVLIDTLASLINGTLSPQKQNNTAATYAKKLSKEEARLDWSLSALSLKRCIHAFNPWPVSYFVIEDTRVKVWQADIEEANTTQAPGTILGADKYGIRVATADGTLILTQLQPAGKKVMHAQELLHSRQAWFTKGTRLD